MIVFAAGNKYKCFSNLPTKIDGTYYVFGWKWIKSKQAWNKNVGTYNIGPHYEQVMEEEA